MEEHRASREVPESPGEGEGPCGRRKNVTRPVVEIREEVLTFDPADQEKWVGGDKWLVPEEFRDDPRFAKSSRAYFLEMTAVHHYRCGGYMSLSANWYELFTKSTSRKPWVER